MAVKVGAPRQWPWRRWFLTGLALGPGAFAIATEDGCGSPSYGGCYCVCPLDAAADTSTHRDVDTPRLLPDGAADVDAANDATKRDGESDAPVDVGTSDALSDASSEN